MKDQALVYKALVNKIELMIDNISELGINTEKYKTILKDIINEVENRTNNSKVVDEIGMLLIQDYENGINKLRKLESVLEEYNVYFKSLNACSYIDIQLEKQNARNLVENYSTKIIEVLKNINNSSTLHYEDERKIIEKVYDTAYKIIKLEIITNGSSIVYDYIKKYDTHLYFINDVVLNEINKINLKDDKYSKINEKLYEIKSNGIDQSYFDLGLIKLLLYYDDNNDLKNNIYIELTNILKEIEDNTKKVLEKNTENQEQRKVLSEIKEKIDYCKKNIIKKTISVALSLFITIGVGVGIYKVTKKLSYLDYYQTKKITYSEWNNLTNEKESLIWKANLTADAPELRTTLKVYGVWTEDHTGRFFRYITSYNLNQYEFENIEDYLKYDISYYNVEGYEDIEYRNNVTNFYNKEYAEVEQYFIDKSQIIEDYSSTCHWVTGVVSYFIYVIIIVTTLCVEEEYYYEIFLNKIKSIIDNIKYLKPEMESNKNKLEELKTNIEELTKIINSNEELIQRFNKLYEENKYLLNNTEELYEKFNELTLNIENNELNQIDTKKLLKRKA